MIFWRVTALTNRFLMMQYDAMEETSVGQGGVSQLPLCLGKFDMEPKLKYPRSAARKGMVGAVIARIALKDGKVDTVNILGSVPEEGFKAAAAETVAQWQWIVSDGEPGVTCRLDRKNLILPMTFQMN